MKNLPIFRLLAVLFLVLGLLCQCIFFGSSEKLWGTAFDVLAVNDRAYICAGGSLLVLDVIDPNRIRLLGQIEISSLTKAVHVAGSYAFVAAGERGLRIIDISDPADMSEVGGIETPRYALDLQVENSRAYVNSEGAWLGFDVTDPQHPVPIASLPDSFSDKTEVGKYRVGNRVFVTDNITLRILDYSDPDQAAEIGCCALRPKSSIQGPGEILVAGDRAYMAVEEGMYEYHLCIVDISNPGKPAVMGTCGISQNVHKHISKIYVTQDRAYVAISFGGVLIVDVSDPISPRIEGSFPTSSHF